MQKGFCNSARSVRPAAHLFVHMCEKSDSAPGDYLLKDTYFLDVQMGLEMKRMAKKKKKP